MHLAIEEQVSIDQPPGIRDAVQAPRARRDSRTTRATTSWIAWRK
jgi:hypothetical protein